MVLTFQSFRIHVLHAPAIERDVAQNVVASQKTLSAAIVALSVLYQFQQGPTALVTYASSGSDLYLTVVAGRIVRVSAPPGLARYFDGLIGVAGPTEADLERGRVLATLQADRAGQNAVSTLKAIDDGVVGDMELELTSTPMEPSPHIGIAYANQGNRYAGRHFVEIDAKGESEMGDQFAGQVRHSPVDFSASRYNDVDLNWSRVTPVGMFGLDARYIRYNLGETSDSSVGQDGELGSAMANWSYVIAANQASRWSSLLSVVYADQTFHDQSTTSPLISLPPILSPSTTTTKIEQKSPAIEAGIAYSLASYLSLSPLTVNGGLSVKRGLGSDRSDYTDVAADLAYTLITTQAALGVRTSDNWNAKASVNYQFAFSTLPVREQSLLGGVGNIAAYFPGVAVGDSGGVAQVQLGYSWIPRPGVFTLDLSTFMEYGLVSSESDTSGTGRQSLADAGIGLDATVFKWLRVAVTSALPIEHKSVAEDARQQDRADVLFSVSARF